MISIVAALSLCCTSAMADRTTRKGLKLKKETTTELKADYDTIDVTKDIKAVRLSGFDKPLRSKYETMFVSNETNDTIYGLVLSLRYTDTRGGELHSREVTVECEIAPEATKQASFKTWDVQSSFYYKLSQKPRRSDGTPFDVSCQVKRIIVRKRLCQTH